MLRVILRESKETGELELFYDDNQDFPFLTVMTKSEGHSLASYDYYTSDTRPVNPDRINEIMHDTSGVTVGKKLVNYYKKEVTK